MESTALLGEPTMTKKHPQLDDEEAEEDDIYVLERKKTTSFHRRTETSSTDDGSTITITSNSSSSSSSDSGSAYSVRTDVIIGKELNVDQNGHGGRVAVESLEASELSQQQTDHGFHGEHHDKKNGIVYFDKETGSESHGLTGSKPDGSELHADRVPEIEEMKKSGSSEDPNAVVIEEEVDTEVVEDYEVEKVLEKQETHDLYCPNCNSCITKRVVLKRRKRKIHRALGDSKREKLDIPDSMPPESDTVEGDSARGADDDREANRGPFLFRCLSCFSIFFPTGEGFKLFPFSKDDKDETQPLLDSQQEDTAKTNWFLSCFGSDNKKTAVKEEDKRVDTDSPDAGKSVVKKTETVKEKQEVSVSSSVEKSQPQINKDIDVTKENQQYKKGKLSPIKASQPKEPIFPVTAKLDSTVITEGKLDVVVDPLKVESKPSEVAPSDAPRDSESLLPTATQTPITEISGIEAGQGRQVEILKSIVYGGLVESITSLGVISSAAGSGASNLNILVLGLANLIGGLILIVHNLQELREEIPTRTATDENLTDEQAEDRYKKLLGRRENFWLHATVAILSFIIFGLIPPVVYGFSFRETGNRDYKAVAVLGASLVCIILLAIGKANVKRPRGSYIKAVLYYATIAVSASGISFFVGDIVSNFLEKNGWSDGSAGPAELMLPLLGRKAGFGYSSF